MKQFDVKAEREIDGNRFYLRPFPAFKAANMTGELVALIMPILGALAPALADKGGGSEETVKSIMDMDATEAAPLLANGAASLSGDKVERILRKLLTQYSNISVAPADGGETQTLTEDLANEIFCGDVQNMFILAFEVIKVNFSGFFKKIGGLFGKVLSDLTKKLPNPKDTEN